MGSILSEMRVILYMNAFRRLGWGGSGGEGKALWLRGVYDVAFCTFKNFFFADTENVKIGIISRSSPSVLGK